jgi:YHS domain-containing protein
MARWILVLVLIWLVARSIRRIVLGIAEGIHGIESKPTAMPLLRDPVCGTFVAPATAPSFGTGSQMRFFCSENCRRIYQAKFAK